MKPVVTLLGAGPGDPELLTVKAVKALRRATVALVDDLVDPGVLTFLVSTHVGSTLLFDGFINTEAVAIGDSRMTALSDFGSTFDAEMTPDVAGVELIGLQAGVAPIPEAGTFALMLAGLGVLSAALRRRAGRT